MAEALTIGPELTLAEAVQIGAEDPDFYGRFFFPKTCRQPGPKFHTEMWDRLLSDSRYVSFEVFRGGAKTSITRLYLSFCIAYGISRTILVVGKSQEAAARTVEWIMRAVEFNNLWSQAFGLRKGSKWSASEADIWHGTDEVPIRVIALGITGSVRGVNVDDYRPDLIVVDDPCDEENTATPEQRKKTADLFFGALAKSLAPKSEAPLAKMVLLQTVLNKEDLISLTIKDSQWDSVVYGCFDAVQQSRWPERWTTDELREEKQAHIDRDQLPLWLREMECKLTDESTVAFPSKFLKYWEVVPEGGRTIIAVDPTPPPREAQDISKSNQLDDACIVVLREYHGQVWVCDCYVTKSPDPFEFVGKIFEFAETWHAREVAIETILFARTTASILEKEMLQRRQWLTIHKVEDKRKKATRIRQEIHGIYAAGKLFFHHSQSELLEQLTTYPAVNHDDCLDALAIGLASLSNWLAAADYIEGEYSVNDELYPVIDGNWQAAP
jgi:hypothetical protein